MSEIEVYEQAAPVTLFRTDDPAEVVAAATRTAEPLADVIRSRKLAVTISGREHVRVEGWCLLGSMLGVFPVTAWTRPIEGGWEARVEARTRHGEIVGAAEAQCDRSEKQWAKRDEYALRSMAQTRATSKALRQPLGFVMTLAGYDPTPLEEMPRDDGAAFTGPDGEPYRVEGAGVAKLITPEQLKKLHATIGELVKTGRFDKAKLHDQILLAYGVESTKDLRVDEASTVIDGLTAALVQTQSGDTKGATNG